MPGLVGGVYMHGGVHAQGTCVPRGCVHAWGGTCVPGGIHVRGGRGARLGYTHTREQNS